MKLRSFALKISNVLREKLPVLRAAVSAAVTAMQSARSVADGTRCNCCTHAYRSAQDSTELLCS